MPTIGLRKAIQEIRLNDEPDSPVYTLDLTDDAVNKKVPLLAGAYQVYKRLMEKMNEEGPIEQHCAAVMSLYKYVINLMLGEGAYEEILAYVKNGHDVPDLKLTTTFLPLIAYLFETMTDVLTVNHNAAVIKYLEGEDAGVSTL